MPASGPGPEQANYAKINICQLFDWAESTRSGLRGLFPSTPKTLYPLNFVF